MRSRSNKDEQLIELAKRGNSEAFGELYEIYAERIFRFIYGHINDRADAEDLTEDVFFKAWKALPAYDHRGLPFSAFLFRSARNALIDYYRQRKTVLPLEELKSGPDGAEPEHDYHIKQESEELKRCLDVLRDDYRTVILLRFLSGLSPEETAEAMERSVGAVRVLQHRALSALKELLEKIEREQL